MNAKDFAVAAMNLVSGDRKEAYGDAVTHYSSLAALVNGYLESVGKASETPLNALDVVTILELLKINRRNYGPFRTDNFVDQVGYAAVAGEIAHHINGNEGFHP